MLEMQVQQLLVGVYGTIPDYLSAMVDALNSTTASIRYQVHVRSTGFSVAGFACERYLVGRASSKRARSSSASKVTGERKVADGYDGTQE